MASIPLKDCRGGGKAVLEFFDSETHLVYNFCFCFFTKDPSPSNPDGLSVLKNSFLWGTWLARSTECETLDLRVVSSSPTLGMEPTLKKKNLNKKSFLWPIPKEA